MTESELRDALASAQEWSSSFYRVGEVLGSDADRDRARRAVLAAERALAAARGEPYAEVVDLGHWWDAGAPLPHVISGSSRTTVLVRANEPDPAWDGTYVHVRSPADTVESAFLEITFEGCESSRFGAPDEDQLVNHFLWGRGVTHYEAHLVRNSGWLVEHRALQTTGPQDSGTTRNLSHYFLTFHDETFEALARSMTMRVVHGTLRGLMHDVTTALTAE